MANHTSNKKKAVDALFRLPTALNNKPTLDDEIRLLRISPKTLKIVYNV